MKKRPSTQSSASSSTANPRREARLKLIENTATFGLLLIAVAMALPFFRLTGVLPAWYMWIYAAGAIIFTVARLCNVADMTDSLRIRRLRRMEFWAGMAFCIASGLWFYNNQRLGAFGGALAIIRPTVVFTLAGAAIQVIASWLIYTTKKKEDDAQS